jgi:hypothetical protein
MVSVSIMEFGAVADGTTLNTASIQAAIDYCDSQGGGTVVVPNGQFLSGAIMLKSCITLHLEAAATIISSMEEEHFTLPGQQGNVGLISARAAHRVAVTGQGTINGQGERFLEPDNEDGDHVLVPIVEFRPKLVDLEGCTDVLFRDVTLYRASSWCLHMTGCSRVNIQGIRILGQLRGPNNDGIDPDCCKDVHISDCHIEAGDDCIVLKTTEYGASRYGTCENITVTNCTFISRSCALKIGTETHADIRNVVFQNCTIRYSNRGLGIWARDGGTIENVLFSNIVIETRLFSDALEQTRKRKWWGKGEPVFITAERRPGGGHPGKIRNISFEHLLIEAENAIYLEGSAESIIAHIKLRDVRQSLHQRSPYPGGVFDTNPSVRGVFMHAIPALFIRHAHDVVLDGVQVDWHGPCNPNWAEGIIAEDVDQLCLSAFRGGPAQAGLPALRMKRIDKLTLERCKAEAGTGAFLELELECGDQGDLFAVGNDWSQAQQAVVFTSAEPVGYFAAANRMPG